MNRIKTCILVGVLLYSVNLLAQTTTISKEKKGVKKDSITELNKVSIRTKSDLEKKTTGQKTTLLGTAEIIRNPINFTETLRYNSPIAFRDYGNGGASSARFRGTSATNTSVLWNGIPINAVGNGQTDFNAISASTTDEIKIVSGGSSASYGSGAIGGVVLLSDNLSFSKHQDFQLFSSYGSYNTSSNFGKANIGIGKWAFKIAGSYNKSDNDYEFLDTRFRDENDNLLKNENANYDNYAVDISLGYKFSNINKLYFYSTKYEGDRLFSAGIPNPSSGSERNQDFNQRNLLKWNLSFSKFDQSLKVAYLTQEYRYFNNRFTDQFSFGKSANWFLDYNLKYTFSEKLNISSFVTYENILGSTDQISNKRRKSIAFGINTNYTPFKTTLIAVSVRGEDNSDFSVPVSLNLGVAQQVIEGFKLKANFSKNYRVPTYNELFWPILGNKDLVPEKTKQFEIGGDLSWKELKITATYFYINIKDKILWFPSGFSNLWRPRNIDKTLNQGVEIATEFKKIVLEHHFFKLRLNYTQTLAKNLETDKRLPFVPQRILNFNFDYNYKRLNLFAQGLYQSKVFTSANFVNNESIEAFDIYNLGLNYKLLNQSKHKITIGFKVNNWFNKLYYFTTFRPNPGRNYQININYKF